VGQSSQKKKAARMRVMLAIVWGVWLLGFVVSMAAGHRMLGDVFSGKVIQASPNDAQVLDRLAPQGQAEALLEQAVGHSEDAVAQISSRVERWQGKVEWNPRIASLTTAALSSDDLRVRESGVEVELAAYGLAKNSASLAYLLKTARSNDHANKIWALWALGLMANQGVQQEKVVETLKAHLKDADADSRQWAVQGLALTGSTRAIAPLLKTMHDDASEMVRERAAGGLAESGMFSRDQRMMAVPQLVNYAEDAALDGQTRAWAFQALGDITHQRLPNDAAAWRKWYEEQ
jgi:hypothetical protein